jgi:hypothetical protein
MARSKKMMTPTEISILFSILIADSINGFFQASLTCIFQIWHKGIDPLQLRGTIGNKLRIKEFKGLFPFGFLNDFSLYHPVRDRCLLTSCSLLSRNGNLLSQAHCLNNLPFISCLIIYF